MKSKFLKTILYCLIIIFSAFFLIFFSYLYNEKEAQYYENIVKKPDSELSEKELSIKKDFQDAFDADKYTKGTRGEKIASKVFMLLFKNLLLYHVRANGKPLELSKFHGKSLNDIYLAPEYAMEMSDAIIGYGVYDNVNFEDQMSILYNIPAYTFDCGIEDINNIRYKKTGKNTFFESECIGTDKFLIEGQVSSKRIHSFGEKLKELNLQNKKIYVKLDIAGSEFEVMPDILQYSNNITGISLIIHMEEPELFFKVNDLLKQLNKDFVLVARYNVELIGHLCTMTYCNQYSKYYLPKTLSVTYINKNLTDSKYMPLNQANIRYKKHGEYEIYDINSDNYTETERFLTGFLISPVLTVIEKFRNIFAHE